jgi:hypothetical protein
VRVSPSHQLPIKPTILATGADRRNWSTDACENCPGNAWASTIKSGTTSPDRNDAIAVSASAHSQIDPQRSKSARTWRNSDRSASPRNKIESEDGRWLVVDRR